jgi:hypothetical protein
MTQRNPRYGEGFAIVRIYGFHRDLDLMEAPELYVSVKRVVWSSVDAAAEVERLNRLHADLEVVYLWMPTRVEVRPA